VEGNNKVTAQHKSVWGSLMQVFNIQNVPEYTPKDNLLFLKVILELKSTMLSKRIQAHL
jgi:hypothetical protein